jgi:hypothetical protein
MDKRVWADARRFEQPLFSERFGLFGKALDAADASIRESLAQKDLLHRQIARRQREEEEAVLLEEAKRLHDEMRQTSLQKTTEERRLDRTMEEH